MAAPLAALGVLSAAGFVLNEISRKKTERHTVVEKKDKKIEFRQKVPKKQKEVEPEVESPPQPHVEEDLLQDTFQLEEGLEPDDILNPGITDEEPEDGLSGIFQTSTAPSRMMLPNSTGRGGVPPEPGLMGPIHIPKQEVQNAQPRPLIPTYMNAPRRPTANQIYPSMKKSYHDGQAPIVPTSGLQRRMESRTRYNPTVPSDRQPLEAVGPAGIPGRDIARAAGEMSVQDKSKRTPVEGRMQQTQGVAATYVSQQRTLPKDEQLPHSYTGAFIGKERAVIQPQFKQSVHRNDAGRPNAPGVTHEELRAEMLVPLRPGNSLETRARAINTGVQYAPVRPDKWNRVPGVQTEFAPPANKVYGVHGARVQNEGQTMKRVGATLQPVANKSLIQGGRTVSVIPGSAYETANMHVALGGIGGGPSGYTTVSTGKRHIHGVAGQAWAGGVGERQPGTINPARRIENTRQYVGQKTGSVVGRPRTSVQTRIEKVARENEYVSGRRGHDGVDGRDFMEFSEKDEMDSERPIIGAYGDGDAAKQTAAEVTRNPRSKTVRMPVF
jgi:hypothetical protein